MERAAYTSIHITGQVPRQVNPTSAAAANVTALTAEILGRIMALREGA